MRLGVSLGGGVGSGVLGGLSVGRGMGDGTGVALAVGEGPGLADTTALGEVGPGEGVTVEAPVQLASRVETTANARNVRRIRGADTNKHIPHGPLARKARTARTRPPERLIAHGAVLEVAAAARRDP